MKIHNRKNACGGLNGVNGWTDDVGVVKDEIHNQFERRFYETSFERPVLVGVDFASLSLSNV